MSFPVSDNRFTGLPAASVARHHMSLSHYDPLLSTVPGAGGPPTSLVRRHRLTAVSLSPPIVDSPSSLSTAVVASSTDVGLLRLNRRGEIVAAHSPAAAASVPALADAHTDADWATIIAALDDMNAQALAPLPSASPTTPQPGNGLARYKGKLYIDDVHQIAEISTADVNADDDDDDDDDDTSVAPRNGTHAATERRRGKKKHGRLTRLIDVIKEDPLKATRQALREAVIALTLVTGAFVVASILTYVFAGSAVAMFVITSGSVVLVTLAALFMVRLNVAQAIGNMGPAGGARGVRQRERLRRERERAEAERKLCRAAEARHMRCHTASRAQSEQALERLRKMEPAVYRKLMAGQELTGKKLS